MTLNIVVYFYLKWEEEEITHKSKVTWNYGHDYM